MPCRGGRVRGILRVATSEAAWKSFDKNETYADIWFGGSSRIYIYDIGEPRVVSYAFLARNSGRVKHEIWASNTLDGYDQNGYPGWTNLYTVTTATSWDFSTQNWPERASDTESLPFRYYLLRCNDSPLNIHAEFYADKILVSQERVQLFPTTRVFGSAELTDGPKIAGHVDYLPSGVASVALKLYVATTDHGYDAAAWQSDPSVHAYDINASAAAGDAYEVSVTGLSTNLWYGRVFAASGNTTVASQTTAEIPFGTSPYYPPAYHDSTKTQHLGCYNGDFNGDVDPNYSSGFVFLPGDDPDVKIVAVRLWGRGSSTYRASFGTFYEDAGTAFDFGVLTPVSSITLRTLSAAEKWPTEGWTRLGGFYDLDLYAESMNGTVLDLPLHPTRFAKYVKFTGADRENWNELEFRTLPRPPEPVVTLELGEAGGTYVGLQGHLDYRGNANKSTCSIYVSCVEPGAAKDYRLLATGWENDTDWSGTVTGLRGETEYEIDVIVSNALAGVTALTDTFTTLEAVPEPPSITFTDVSSDADGRVTFSWQLVNTGTAGSDVEVYARWGADIENLCSPVRIAEHVATGNGSATCESVPLGSTLVFVLNAVNTAGTEAEGTRTSATTAPLVATTPGPSSFASGMIYRETATGTLRARGELAVIGLGESEVTVAYALVGSSVTNTVAVKTYTAASTKTFDATFSLPDDGRYFCRLQMDNGARGASWHAVADECVLEAGVVYPVHLPYDRVCLDDGSASTYVDNKTGPYTLDLGNLRKVNAVWMIAHGNAGNAAVLGASVWVSADGVDYVKAGDYPRTNVVKGTYVDIPLATDLGRVRYVQLRGNGSTRFDLAELRAIGPSSELVVTATKPRPWGSTLGKYEIPVNQADDPQGVYFSGKLTCGGPAHVYACLSQTDLGDDADAWLAATHADLGEFADGANVAGYLPGAARGQYYGKLVAVKGNDTKAVSPQVFYVNVGTVTYPDALCVKYSTRVNDAYVYDNTVWTSADPNDSSSYIFPLKGVRGYRPVAVRLWQRDGNVGRLLGAKVSVCTNDPQIVFTDYLSSPRPVKTFADEDAAAIEGWKWTTVASFGTYDDFTNDGWWELAIPWESVKGVTYLRVNGIARNNCGEMEVRLVKENTGFILLVR